MKLTFHGAVKEVTGANYLLETDSTRILVDCGMIQGGNYVEKQNWEPFPYDLKIIDAVFITHSHIDHIGRLPRLVNQGFKGKIYSSPPTGDAAELLLKDSVHILEQEAKKQGRDCLCAEEDVPKVMALWETIDYHRPMEIGDLKIILYNAGHILGSASILVEDQSQTRIIFSGDLGNSPAPLIGDKDNLPEVDYVVIESTYGGRRHEDLEQRREILEDAIEDTAKAGGVLMIPAFAMERTQELLSEIDQLINEGRIPRLPIFVDSPLAIGLTEVYKKYKSYLSGSAPDFNFPGLKMTLTRQESEAITQVAPPKVIIAGSGMSHGGRIVRHEKIYLPDPKSAILFIGHQGQGSMGRQILDGAKAVKIFGEQVPVQAKVKSIGGYSAHADQPQLLDWLRPQRQFLKKIFVVQGEEDQSSALVQKIKDELAVETEIPNLGQPYML